MRNGDCLEVMRGMAESSVDAIVTDPPYGLEFMGKEWDSFRGEAWRSGAGMSKPGIGDRPTAWPSFGGGDSANATCASCGGRMRGKKKCRCEHPDWRVKGKPLGQRNARAESMQSFGTWCEAWAAEALRVAKPGAHLLAFGGTRTFHRLACAIEDAGWEFRDTIMWVYGSGFPKSKNLDSDWQGWGTALKPSHEPVIVARKPLSGTVAENVQAWGTGALNIDGCRVAPTGESSDREGEQSRSRRYTDKGGTNFAAMPGVRGGDPLGRWPANLIHDGSDEVVGLFPNQQSGANPTKRGSAKFKNAYGEFAGQEECVAHRGADSGSAARFFYCAKASRAEREMGCEGLGDKNNHPTVKPLALMRYLCRLVTPPGGLILDPFAGSGTTGVAALQEGFRFVGIEKEPEYVAIAEARMAAVEKDLFAEVG